MAKLKLKYDRLSYQANRDELSIAEVKAEYTRFKRIAKDRFSRMTEFQNTERYQYYNALFKQGVRGKSESELRKMLYTAYTFVSNPANTLTAMKKHRQNVIDSLNASFGEDLLNKDNINQFYDFMNDRKMRVLANGLDSGQMVDLFRLKMKGVSTNSLMKDFADYLDHSSDIVKYLDEHPNRKRAVSSYDLRSILKGKKK